VLRDLASGSTQSRETRLLLAMIGARPHTDWLDGAVCRDKHGSITTGHDLDPAEAGWSLPRPPLLYETSMPGVFAAGDVRYGSSKRVASAVGDGAVAVRQCHEYLASPESNG
jgi:thioredoxin reductase (NADPH)